MYSNSRIAKAVRLALICGTSSAALLSTNVIAQEEGEQEVERIEVTGSSIKRTDMEGALPIDNISAEDIAASGVTSVPDLMNQIPAMQGFTTAADSVGGGGGGIQTASLRDLGSTYTLVLLNGRRMAAADSGGSIDLNSIPLSAIERVEILKDGASAIYGSDAIAGVVNFILKKDVNETTIRARFDKPQEEGGESNNFSISTGFGDLSSDGFNVMVAYSRDEQERLKSSQREFAKTGLIPFEYHGNDLVWQRTSSNSIPANAYLTIDGASKNFNPYFATNGSCAPKNAPEGDSCIYDFTETLEIHPESVRDNVFVQGVVEIADDHELYSTLSYSKFDITSRIAPYPTGTFTLPMDSALVQDNIIPLLTADEVAGLERVAVRWRTRPGGNRTNEYSTDTINFNLGMKGDIGDLSYDVALTYGSADRANTRVTGYPLEEELMNLLESGAVNIFDVPENLSAEANQAVKDTMYSGLWQTTETTAAAIEAKASMPVFELPAGDVYVGGGFDYRTSDYAQINSQANNDEVILFESASDEFDLSRDTYGVFTEVIAPLAEGLELTAALRYDNIGEITDSKREGNQTVNEDKNDTTYKIGVTYRPNDDWLLRASVGTGFKAPSMRQIAEPRIEFGVTSSAYSCPFGASDPMAQYCFDGSIQYDILREGYAKLEPEKSEQTSVGFVYSPSTSFSLAVDWWQVDLEDQVARLEETQIFGDPVRYRDLFTTKIDGGTGDEVLAIIRAPVNVGESNNQGIDWSMNITNEFDGATLRTSLQGTYMIESERLVVGSTDEYQTSLGRFGDNNAVTFRNIIRIDRKSVV